MDDSPIHRGPQTDFQALHAVTNELSLAGSLDELCRQAVELGRSRLGFDRLSVWFTTENPLEVRGSFGTDEDGRLRDERSSRLRVSPESPMGQVLARKMPCLSVRDAPLGNQRAETVGTGAAAVAALWNGRDVIGFLAADNLLRREEISPSRQELLTLYGSALGHLCSLKRAEQSLRRNEEKYRTLVESAGEAICTMDADCRFLFINATAAERMGGQPQDFVGKTMWDLFPKEIADRQANSVRKVIRSGEAVVLDSPTFVGGRECWYYTSIVPLADGAGHCSTALIVAQDITELKQAEEDLRRSELLYHTTIDALSDSLHVVDRDLRVTFLNASFAKWCRELSLETDAAGKNIFKAFPFLPDKIRDEYRRVFETGRPLLTEERHILGSREFIVETLKTPVWEGDRVDRVITVVRDITARKRAEAGLQAAHAKLVHAREAERRRLAGELHDSLGQKLVALQLLAQNATTSPGARQDAGLAKQLAELSAHCGKLVQDVRGLCHGLYPPTLESLGLASALEQLAEHCRAADVEARVVCPRWLQRRRLPAKIEIALFRVAQEAVNNALRHGRPRHVRLQLDRRKDHLVLTVTNDGVEFDASEAARRGLGLNMMQERANAVSGELRVESEPGRTRVQLRVPVLEGLDGPAERTDLAKPPARE